MAGLFFGFLLPKSPEFLVAAGLRELLVDAGRSLVY